MVPSTRLGRAPGWAERQQLWSRTAPVHPFGGRRSAEAHRPWQRLAIQAADAVGQGAAGGLRAVWGRRTGKRISLVVPASGRPVLT